MKILVTGCAGFIGFHLCERLLKLKKYHVYGIDNLNNYYDIKLKTTRLNMLKVNKKFFFKKIDISEEKILNNFFKKNKFECVINLAAQAGVRYSIEFPQTYLKSNIIGFFNILECSKKFKIKHLIYASTSSVYGNSKKFPLRENHNTDNPLSFYAATKKSNEVMAYSYSNIHKLPCTGLRFFTVYGPYGRPDMSILRFIHWIMNEKEVKVFGNGEQQRSFTFIEDVITALIKMSGLEKSNTFNVGSNITVSLNDVIKLIEEFTGKSAKIENLERAYKDPDVVRPNLENIKNTIGWEPTTKIEEGIAKTVSWYKENESYLKELVYINE